MATMNFYCDIPSSVFIGGVEVTDQPVNVPDTCRLVVNVIPAITDCTHLAYTVILRLAAHEIVSATGGATVIDWGQGLYDVRLTPPVLPIRHTPVTLAQSGEKSLATLYDDGEMHLMCEGAGFVVHDVPRLVEYTLSSSERAEFIAVLRGKTLQKEYFLALSTADGGIVLHEHLADTITPTEEGVLVTERLVDMQSRTRTALYASGGAVLRQDFQRMDRRFAPPLIPYALLEAVHCGDLDDACTMLSAELADRESLTEFFGQFDVICQPRGDYTDFCAATYRLSDGVCRPRIYTFTLDGDIITSVNEI